MVYLYNLSLPLLQYHFYLVNLNFTPLTLCAIIIISTTIIIVNTTSQIQDLSFKELLVIIITII